MKKVFLGGTCNESKWRDELISMLKNIDYFNPVVKDWTEECMKEELIQRKTCDYCLYVITPRMTGVYSIAEAVDDSNKRPEKTIFCVLELDEDCRASNSKAKSTIKFDLAQLKSLKQVSKMIKKNGGHCFDSLNSVAYFINNTEEHKVIKRTSIYNGFRSPRVVREMLSNDIGEE